MLQACPQLVAAENQHSELREIFIPSGVIGVDMCVDEKPNRLVRNLPDRRNQPLGQRRELRIELKHAQRNSAPAGLEYSQQP